MHYINDTWKPSGIVISEFGFGIPFENMQTIKADILSDLPRRVYYRQYMEALLIAISEGLPIKGVIA